MIVTSSAAPYPGLLRNVFPTCYSRNGGSGNVRTNLFHDEIEKKKTVTFRMIIPIWVIQSGNTPLKITNFVSIRENSYSFQNQEFYDI